MPGRLNGICGTGGQPQSDRIRAELIQKEPAQVSARDQFVKLSKHIQHTLRFLMIKVGLIQDTLDRV